MSKDIDTTNIDKFGRKHIIDGSLDTDGKKLKTDIRLGKCIFPFNYKGSPQYDCIDGKDGLWCATKLSSSGGVKKRGFCVTKKTSKVKANSPAKKSVTNSPGKPKKPSQKKSTGSKAATKKKPPTNSTSNSGAAAAPKGKPNNVCESSGKTSGAVLKLSTMKELGLLRKHKQPEIDKVAPTHWEIPNRKRFPKWIDDTYNRYLIKREVKKCIDPVECKPAKFDLFNHQKFVRDYLQNSSPYRGILLYHGLGVGKSCASIAIAEGFSSNKKIIVILNKSLKQNFKINILKCGDEYMRLKQHWIHKTLPKIGEKSKKSERDALLEFGETTLCLNRKNIEKRKCLWLIDFSLEPNYEDKSPEELISLHEQIDEMINSKYEFIHLNGLTSEKLKRMNTPDEFGNRKFDNKLVIIDEVHNLTNSMSKSNPGVRARELEKLIMNAVNLNLVFLSGTPMINNLFELSKLFNLLRGWINLYYFTLKPIGPKQESLSNIDVALQQNTGVGLVIDQHFIDKRNSIVKITRIPNKFINHDAGLTIDEKFPNNESEDEFIEIMKEFFKQNGYDCRHHVAKFSALPNNEVEFYNKFLSPSRKLQNVELFKSRILGLVSHYASQNTSQMPEIRNSEILGIPMSDYQFLGYSRVRKIEIEREKTKKTKGKKTTTKGSTPTTPERKKMDDNEEKSSYRAYSRMHCSFVFPETIERPLPGGSTGDIGQQMDDASELDTKDVGDESVLDDDEEDDLAEDYETRKAEALRQLESLKYDLFVYSETPEEKLAKYSPKYNTVVGKILENPGSSFVYTEYRTLEGIAVFQIVLKANGFIEFNIEKDEADNWFIPELEPSNGNFDIDWHKKKKFVFWGGDEEKSDIFLKVFNNEFDKIPSNLKEQLLRDPIVRPDCTPSKPIYDTINVLLTTKKGAEGISLHNVRQVHIIEPYWNPVRLQQVQGRAIRVGSHLNLPPRSRNVDMYIYLGVMTKEQLKSDRILMDDKGGLSSDEVLFDISQRKKDIMNSALKLIKEVSIDCRLNSVETQDPKNQHKCINYTFSNRNSYAYVPNIEEEAEDDNRRRHYDAIRVEYKRISITDKKTGKKIKYALKIVTDGPDLIYDLESVNSGRPNEPIGEIIKGKPVFY